MPEGESCCQFYPSMSEAISDVDVESTDRPDNEVTDEPRQRKCKLLHGYAIFVSTLSKRLHHR